MDIGIKDVVIERHNDSQRRARKEMGNLLNLASSIERHGLMHPIVVDKLEDGKWRLIAGERRYRACMLNGQTLIKATLIKDVDDVSAKEMEIEENIVRQNLSWPEECDALRQLNDLKKAKYGSAQPGSLTGWGMADTANAVGMSKSAVAQDIKLAKDLIGKPELLKKVRRLPKTAARKIVRMTIEAAALKAQVDKHQLSINSVLKLGDCCSLIDELADESVNLLITDPPFGLAAISETGARGTSSYAIDKENVSDEDTMRKTYKILWPKMYKKLVPGAHIYVFFAMGWHCELLCMLTNAGFIVDDLPLIWHKQRTSVLPKDDHYPSCYEAIFFGHKPPMRRILTHPVPNLISIPAVAPQKRTHPLQKPFELLKVLIENSSSVGEVVLDCFAGSGMTLIAAKKLQRSAVGFELDEGNFLRAQKFIEGELK